MIAPSRDILAIGDWSTNADLIAGAAALGYIEGRCLDLTYGEGAFWRTYRPEDLCTNDLLKPADFHYDGRATGFDDKTFDTVVWDPPYKLAGGRGWGDNAMDGLYGTEVYASRQSVHTLLNDGVTEAVRLSRRWVLVKCQDQVNAGKIRWQTDEVTAHALSLGLEKVDSMMLRRWRPQPAGRRQLHARRNYSTLLVFRKPR